MAFPNKKLGFWRTVLVGIKSFLSGLISTVIIWLVNITLITLGFVGGFAGIGNMQNSAIMLLGIFLIIGMLILDFAIMGFINSRLWKWK
jgi:hypothetical protein